MNFTSKDKSFKRILYKIWITIYNKELFKECERELVPFFREELKEELVLKFSKGTELELVPDF